MIECQEKCYERLWKRKVFVFYIKVTQDLYDEITTSMTTLGDKTNDIFIGIKLQGLINFGIKGFLLKKDKNQEGNDLKVDMREDVTLEASKYK
ncbi:hypothetical protein CR513_60225, partial [Mucuna pruriens]